MKHIIITYNIILLLIMMSSSMIHSTIPKKLPIGFSISSKHIVDKIPEKIRDFATIIPGNVKTYIFNEEQEYYKNYQESFYAITSSKYEWDCMRHYEILAIGHRG